MTDVSRLDSVPVDALTDARCDALRAWLLTLPAELAVLPETLSVASADASFRRYFRVLTRLSDAPSLIVMDAPPEHEDCRPFVQIAQLLGAAGVNVPKIVAQDVTAGFLLLSDFGQTTLLAALSEDVGGLGSEPCSEADSRADGLYRQALTALVQMQKHTVTDDLPAYNRERLLTELRLFPEWYLGVHCGYSMSDEQTAGLARVFDVLLDNNTAQSQVCVHRDYHSRNLMVTAAGDLGILDFQDAVAGPITYDAVSLLRDAYIEWTEAQQLDWLVRYWQAARVAGLNVPAEFDVFYRDFEYMGLQRHLKVLGIFARLYHRDGKAGYLANMPLVLKYTRTVAARYRDFAPLVRLLDEVLAQVNAGVDAQSTQVGYTF